MQLSSAGYLQGFNQIPRVDKELLARHSKGLIALSGGEDSEINSFVLKDEAPLASRIAGEYQDLFGKDRFFLDIQDHRKPADAKLRKLLSEISQKTAIPLIAATDAPYLRQQAP